MKSNDDSLQPGANPGASQQAEQADLALLNSAFDKLPILGPIAWLYARASERRFLFLTDLDWAVMPPVVLDQCRLFMRGKMPFAFITWARVSDAVQERLLQGQAKLAPHEWKGGSNLWLIDVVTPFGGTQEALAEVQSQHFPGQPLRYLALNPATQRNEVQTFNPGPAAATPARATPEPIPDLGAAGPHKIH